jgi:hypothetical protein
MSRRAMIAVLALILLASCSGSSEPEIPGLDPNDEVELVEMEPEPRDDSYVWTQPFRSETSP